MPQPVRGLQGRTWPRLIQRSRDELRAPLMADVDSLENGLRAAELGCDWVGTTLYGYTEDTAQQRPPSFDLLPQLRAELPSSVRLVCEGGIASPAHARLALQAGADTVVVGDGDHRSGPPGDRLLPGNDQLITSSRACPCRPFRACPCLPFRPCHPWGLRLRRELVQGVPACRQSQLRW